MADNFSHNDGNRPFNPDEVLLRLERLKQEGRMPTPEEFFRALQEAILETDIEKTDPS